ncbi:MAG: hypothetical protein MZU79_02110 [Anaerotruncus sp.]|nr:hypothetical protein [Anaerotruncus sp.]
MEREKNKLKFNILKTDRHVQAQALKRGTAPTTCPTCKGHGQIQQTTQTILGQFTQVSTCPAVRGMGNIFSPCKSRSGQGRKETSKVISIKIPKGMNAGNKLRINSEGDAGIWRS